MNMQVYNIDYEYGRAIFITPEADATKALREFGYAASLCFGIRKSVGDVNILSQTPGAMPVWFSGAGGTHYLKHSGGDEILFDSSREGDYGEWYKIKSEFD